MSKLRQELVQYSNLVLGGYWPACEKHKWACARFLRDLEREGTADFPYIFDESKAERFFNWFRLFKHRKGVLRGQQLEPAPIQRFVFGNVYGWRHMVSGYRRFQKMYWQVARKNGKSQSLAAVATYELMARDEEGAEAQEVYCAATKTEQARIVYQEAVAMLNGRPDLFKGKWREAYGKIEHKKTESIMRALSREDRKTGDGLNPSCGIIDEYHAHETSDAYDIIDSGMGARAEPLLAIITTAGFDLNNPCYEVEYRLVSKILNPEDPVELDQYFVMVNELEINRTAEAVFVERNRETVKVSPGELLDDPFDEAAWPKANPIICSYAEGVQYLRNKAAEAKLAPEKLRNFKTKHINVWVNERTAAYMNLDKWAACFRPRDTWPSFKGLDCWVGLDLSARNDLTSSCLVFKIDDKYYVLSHSFLPEIKADDPTLKDRVQYRLWEEQGWVTVTGGEVVDYREVIRYTKQWAKDLGAYVREWCIDSWGATQIQADLQDEGHTVIEIVQGIRTLCEPTKDFRNMVVDRRVVHEDSPVVRFSMSNAVCDVVDRNENIILNKRESKQRIDPVAAIINAHVRAMVGEAYRDPRVIVV